MSSELWRSLIGVDHDSTGPSRIPAWSKRRMRGASVNLTRDKIASIQRRDPRRAAEENRILLSTYGVEWDFPITSALEYLYLVASGIADSGRTESAGGTTIYKVGRGGDPVRTDIFLDGIDGSHYAARKCLLTDWILAVDLVQQCQCQATFTARELEVLDAADTFAAAPASGRPATAIDSLVTIGETQYPVFGWSVAFQREAKAGGLDEHGVASAWDGQLMPDIGGKLVCRCTGPDFDEALTSQRIDPITCVVQIPGGSVLTLAFPRCILQATTKVVRGTGLFEYSLEWAATQQNNDDLATITVEE